MVFPKITIITPNLNDADYLEHTIHSVLDQEYPNLEYIIIDGGSTDRSVEIIKKYENKLAFWISEEDEGLYDALQKGFERSTGEIMGWLNSDDLLIPKSLWTVAELFKTFQDVEWVQGQGTSLGSSGKILDVSPLRRWSKYHYYIYQYKWIQQESIYWRRSLWEKCGSQLNTKLKLAGDFDLWLRFFEKAQLYSTSTLIGGFRFRAQQLSQQFEKQYSEEVNTILKQKLNTFSKLSLLKIRLFKLFHFFYRVTIKIGFNSYNLERSLFRSFFQMPPFLIYSVKQKIFVKSNRPRLK